VLDNNNAERGRDSVKQKVLALCARFPVYS
jgi:hypothetical protein